MAFERGDPTYFRGFSDPLECWYGDLNGRPLAYVKKRRPQFFNGELTVEVLSVRKVSARDGFVVFEETHSIVGKLGRKKPSTRLLAMRPGPEGWQVVAEASAGSRCEEWMSREAERND